MIRDLCIWPPYLRCLCAVQHLVQLHQTECDWSGDNPGGTSQLKSVYGTVRGGRRGPRNISRSLAAVLRCIFVCDTALGATTPVKAMISGALWLAHTRK